MTKKYKTAPIDEALCEIAFGGTEQDAWDLTLPGKLQLQIQSDYGGPPRHQHVQSVAGDQSNVTIQSTLFRIQLPTRDGSRVVSIGPNTLALSILRPYQSWEDDFKPRLKKALDAYRAVTEMGPAVRVGVRYINKIVVPGIKSDPEEYLSSVVRNNERLGGTLTDFVHRSEYLKHDLSKLIVTQATIVPSKPDSTEFLLDIDAVWDNSPVDGVEAILEQAEKLHASEKNAFESLITQKARELFDAV